MLASPCRRHGCTMSREDGRMLAQRGLRFEAVLGHNPRDRYQSSPPAQAV